MRKALLLLTLTLPLIAARLFAFTPTEDGLYAVFDTSMGEYTAKLFYQETPRTVSNFVALAEGDQEWLKYSNASINRNTPFYDNLIFHRVYQSTGIKIIQSGSPNGKGTDGPGYVLNDEIVPNSTVLTHDRAGVLSMANTGAGNDNGSQFFVTLVPSLFLDGKHTVFGEVIDGMAVVEAISDVAVDANNKPLEDVVLNHVTIVREGAAAEAFDATAIGLPTLRGITPDIIYSPGTPATYRAILDLLPINTFSVFQSDELKTWTYLGRIPRNIPAVIGSDIGYANVPTGPHKAFWKTIETTYPDLVDRTGYVVYFEYPENPNIAQSPTETLKLTLDEFNGGYYNYNGGTDFPFSSYQWNEYNGIVNLRIDFGDGLYFHFYFPNQASGDAWLYFPPDRIYNVEVNQDATFTLTAP